MNQLSLYDKMLFNNHMPQKSLYNKMLSNYRQERENKKQPVYYSQQNNMQKSIPHYYKTRRSNYNKPHKNNIIIQNESFNNWQCKWDKDDLFDLKI
jgi:hypothetical protein